MSDPGTAPTLDALRRAWVRINYSGEIRRLGSAEDVYNRALALFDHPGYFIAALPASLPAPPAVTPPCVWKEDEEGQWLTACGHHFEFHSEPPHDWCKYCCYCGSATAFVYYDEMAELNAELAAEDVTPTPGEGT